MINTLLRRLDSYKSHAYALLRIVAGFMIACRGAQSIFGAWGGSQPDFGSRDWFEGLIELVGGSAVMLGVRAREAAFLCSAMMAVDYLEYHWKFNLGVGFIPVVNGGEVPLLYGFVFFLIACQGAGRWTFGR